MSISSSYKRISDYGIIGNCRSAALVGIDGSIDWCCFPRFDSPSVFAGILDIAKGGRFAITPEGLYSSTQSYCGDTNVLETRFETTDGVCSLTDCMPLYQRDDSGPVELYEIIRVLRCHQGMMTFKLEYSPRPDYARVPVQMAQNGSSVVWTDGPMSLSLQSRANLTVSGDVAQGTLALREGEDSVFVLSYSDSVTQESPDVLTPQQRIDRTKLFWQEKVADLKHDGPWRKEVIRSYLVLHLLMYLPAGSIVAAPTSSLPEAIGGVRNWDYRYTWLRDAAFTVDALLALGHEEEALSFFQWLGKVCATYGDDIQIVYRVDATADLPEEELSHLEGYRGSRPVRIGNAASRQRQNDIFGEVLASAHLLGTTCKSFGDDEWELLCTLASLAAARWGEPDNGIWEVRSGPSHFVYSKLMCWVALDRAVSLARVTGREGEEISRWRRTADAIKMDILKRGWSQEKRAFVQHYDSEAMDASTLLLPIMGLLSFDDPRVVSTVQRIRDELGFGPFLHRYRTQDTDDGLAGGEGAFTLCSFWLVRVLAGMGKVEEARGLFEQLLLYSNHLGLFSEMVDPRTGEALGNFPQAFTHVGLILAAQECGMGAVPGPQSIPRTDARG